MMSVALVLTGAARAEETKEAPPASVEPMKPEGVVPPAVAAAPAIAPAPPTFKVSASLQDGLKLESTDGNYGVQLGALVWTRFDAAITAAGAKDEFAVPLMRPTLRAHFFRPWVSLFVQPELAGTPKLLDLELDVHPIDGFGVKLGQFITPYGRSFLTPVPKLRFQGFTMASEVFRANRDTGIAVYGALLDARLEYTLGLFNGNGIDVGFNDNPQLLYAARLAGTLFGTPPPARGYVKYDETSALSGTAPPTLMVGIDGSMNKLTTAMQPDVQQRAASVDAAFLYKTFSLQTEGYLQGLETVGGPTTTRFGADVQAGLFVLPSTLEVAARFSWVRFDASNPNAWVVQGDAQLGWYLAGNHLKAVARYTLTDAASAQRGFAVGITHGVFVQIQAWL